MTTAAVRLQQEDLERMNLSPFAALSAESRGRARPEEKCPIRTDFQCDRDRIVHSKAFRRLKHKTQVFIDPDEDHYRTRLTHTLEVAQIARTVARALRLNEDLTEAIALGHDLGHTPFGHSGERALDEVYAEFVPGASFRHNEQSLRVVDFLERDGQGLNLTWEVRNGILHHSKGSDDIDLAGGRGLTPLEGEAPSEPRAFSVGSDGASPSRGDQASNPSSNGCAATLEGKVVRISDRIAYINHDIDDSIRAGVLCEEDLPSDCLPVLGRRHCERIASMVADLVEQSRGKPELSMSGEIVAAMDTLKDFLFTRVYGLDSRRLGELEKAERLVKELFRHYMAQPDLLPKWRLPELNDLHGTARAVCDFIAGMTDRYAEQRYMEYFMPEHS